MEERKLQEGQGKAQTLLKLSRSYMKPVFCNQVTWNSLQKIILSSLTILPYVRIKKIIIQLRYTCINVTF